MLRAAVPYAGEGVGVQQRARAHRRQRAGLVGDVRGAVHGGLGEPRAGVGVARPVDLLAAGVGRHQERLVEPGGVRDAVQRAQAVDRHVEGGREGRGRDEPDPQPGVRAGADADDDVADRAELHAGLGEHPVDGGQQQFAVPAGVDLAFLGEDAGAVVDGDGDGGGCGVQSKQQHATKTTARPRVPRRVLPSPVVTRVRKVARRCPQRAARSSPL